jgi:hypothetical protein
MTRRPFLKIKEDHIESLKNRDFGNDPPEQISIYTPYTQPKYQTFGGYEYRVSEHDITINMCTYLRKDLWRIF